MSNIVYLKALTPNFYFARNLMGKTIIDFELVLKSLSAVGSKQSI